MELPHAKKVYDQQIKYLLFLLPSSNKLHSAGKNGSFRSHHMRKKYMTIKSNIYHSCYLLVIKILTENMYMFLCRKHWM